jgi:hypothetical protein
MLSPSRSSGTLTSRQVAEVFTADLELVTDGAFAGSPVCRATSALAEREEIALYVGFTQHEGHFRTAKVGSGRSLFDHLVGTPEQRHWNGDAERLGRFEVDDQRNGRGLLHGQVPGLLALKNPAGVDASPSI